MLAIAQGFSPYIFAQCPCFLRKCPIFDHAAIGTMKFDRKFIVLCARELAGDLPQSVVWIASMPLPRDHKKSRAKVIQLPRPPHGRQISSWPFSPQEPGQHFQIIVEK